MNTLRPHGIIPPLVTPLTGTAEVDKPALRQLVETQIAAGVHGLFALGSTGEVGYFTDNQRSEVAGTIIEAAAGRVPVLVGCIDLSPARVVEQARRAEHAGADAIVATAPFYTLNDVDEVADHFRTIAAAVNVPLLAYDVPVRVHAKLSVPMLMQLAAEQVIIGVKDSSGDDVAFRLLVRANRAAGNPLALLSGHELMCDGMILLGADGLVPGLANVDPAGYVSLWNAATAGDWSAAVTEQERLADLFEIVFQAPTRSLDARGVGAFKAAMVELGAIPAATMAYPVQAVGGPSLDAIRTIVNDWRSASSTGRSVSAAEQPVSAAG